MPSKPPSESTPSWTVQEFPSSLETAKSVEEAIVSLCAASGFAADDLAAIRLALEEALVNAIKHGNRLDPRKKVHVSYRVGVRRLDVAIEDEGPGFDPAALPDPCEDHNLEATHGRGVLLMRASMDHVEFNARGNRVSMTKLALPPAPNAAPP